MILYTVFHYGTKVRYPHPAYLNLLHIEITVKNTMALKTEPSVFVFSVSYFVCCFDLDI